MEELISVLMPVYNVEKYVSEAIESILNQTYQNIQFIIIDDCSTDNSYEICKKYAEKDTRIILLKNEKNLKIEGTLNKGLSYVSGKYVVRMDGDDISTADRIQVMYDFLKNNTEFELVGTSTETIDADGNFIGRTKFLSDWNLIKKTACLRTPVVHIWMTYKYIYDELNGYRSLYGSEDYDFLLRFMTNGHKCTNISDKYCYKIRVNREGNSGNTFGLRKIKSKNYTAKLYKQRLKIGRDTYSVEDFMANCSSMNNEEKRFQFSSKCMYRAIDMKRRKRFLSMCIFVLLSLTSKYQAMYIREAILYRFLTLKK